MLRHLLRFSLDTTPGSKSNRRDRLGITHNVYFDIHGQQMAKQSGRCPTSLTEAIIQDAF